MGGIQGQVVKARTPNWKVIVPLSEASRDIGLHIEFMDAAGIDMAVITTNVNSLETAKITNNEFSKISKQYPRRFLGDKPPLDD